MLPPTLYINHQPAVLYGLSWAEIIVITPLSVVTGGIAGYSVATLISLSVFALGLSAIFSVIMAVALGKFIAQQKRQRPQGYYAQKIIRLFNAKQHDLITTATVFGHTRNMTQKHNS